MNKVIIINGPSCAGKTTIAKEICKQSDNQFVHLQIDEAKKYLFTILDSKSTPRKIGRPICDETLLQTAKNFLRNGKNIVIDTTFDGEDRWDVIEMAKYHIAFFKNSKVLFVGVNYPVEERLRRFKANNNNPVRNEATIIEQSNVFELCKEFYDIWFDNSLLNSDGIASNILHHTKYLNITPNLDHYLIAEQFSEYPHLSVDYPKKQEIDNRAIDLEKKC
jgi:chloramphenicol 3-O-phosphotransferase